MKQAFRLSGLILTGMLILFSFHHRLRGGGATDLFAPDGVTPISTVTFGGQFRNVSQGCFPDGDTNPSYFMTNWTPRAAKTLPA